MKKYLIVLSVIVAFIITIASCKKATTTGDTTPPASVSELSAGDETIFDESASAFGDDFLVIPGYLEYTHDVGEVVFNEIFNPPPGYANAYYTGLGPIYNNNSCNACHGGVGEGNPPAGGGSVETSMLFRISSGNSTTAGPIDVPGFGGQLQNNAVAGIQPEGTVNITYTTINGTFPDGTSYQLQQPTYQVINAYTAFPAIGMGAGDAQISPRVAPRLIGLGFLEAIPASQIEGEVNPALAPNDTTQINGQVNLVWDFTTSSTQLGRFGWKAEQPSVKQQLCGAYNQDMGVTNSVFPTESSKDVDLPQYAAYNASGDTTGDPHPEIPDSELYANVEYIQTLAVPAERNGTNPQVIQGQQLFTQVGCAGCHTPTFTTPVSITYVDSQPYADDARSTLANTVIHPYSDMLLHDMGALLADNRPTYLASGRQWRTPPLWGIGLVPIVDPSGQYLHDGRARTITEAILWHGGEATTVRTNFMKLSSTQRAALVAFVQSL